MMHLPQLGTKIVRREGIRDDLLGTIAEASQNPRRQSQQATLDSRPLPMALYATSPCDRTVNLRHALLLLDLNDPRVAYRQSRFPVHPAEAGTEVVETTINTVGLTDLPSKDFPARDLQAIEAAPERQRGTREILMGLNVVIGMTARGLGGLLLMPVILVKSLAAPLAASLCRRSKCPVLKMHETMFARPTSGNLYLRSRCLAPMV